MDRCMHTYMYVHLVKLRYQSSDLGCRLVDKGADFMYLHTFSGQ